MGIQRSWLLQHGYQLVDSDHSVFRFVDKVKNLVYFLLRDLEVESEVHEMLELCPFQPLAHMVLAQLQQFFWCYLVFLHKSDQIFHVPQTPRAGQMVLRLRRHPLQHHFGELLLVNKAVFVLVQQPEDIEYLSSGVPGSEFSDKPEELIEINESIAVLVYFFEELARVLLPGPYNSDNLIDFPGEHVLLRPEVDVEELVLDLGPIKPSGFVAAQVSKQGRDFVGSDGQVDFSEHGGKGGLVDLVVLVLADDGAQVGLHLGHVVLELQQNPFGVFSHRDAAHFLAGLVVLDQRVLECLRPAQPLALVDYQASDYEVASVLADLRIVGESQRSAVDALEVIFQGSAGPRRIPEDHLVEHQAQTPDVRQRSIRLISEQLRGHVDWSSAYVRQLLLAQDVSLTSEAEVCHFVDPIFHKHVRRLYISVDEALFDHDLEALHDLIEYLDAFWLSDLSGGQFLPEVGVAELQHDVGEAAAHAVGHHLDRVGRFEEGRDLDFAVQGSHQSRFFVELLHVHLLYRVELLVRQVQRLPHLPVAALPQKALVLPVVLPNEGELIFSQHIFHPFKYYLSPF